LSEIVLHDEFRSPTAYRVRIALETKGLADTEFSRHLRHGDHSEPRRRR
jgi:maleylpyruvate isomerase